MMKVTRAEVALIRAGFACMDRDRKAAAQTFYAHLFQIAPENRDLFVADMDRQAMKLMDTLAIVVEQVEKWGLLRPSLENLALRHTAYGVRPEHYALAGMALMATLRDRMGAEFTPEMEAVWQRVYDEIRMAMIDAAYPLHADDLT
jgi:hemoglobin-like flavoprotein